MAGKGLPAHAFLSVAPVDRASADRLQAALEAAGIRVSRDIDLRRDDDESSELRRGFARGDVRFLACYSPASVAHRDTRQDEALAVALAEAPWRLSAEIWLFPVRFDQCVMPDTDIGAGLTLRSLRPFDLFGGRAEAERQRLVTSVRRRPAEAARRPSPWQRVMAWDRSIRNTVLGGLFVVLAALLGGLLPYLLGAYGRPEPEPTPTQTQSSPSSSSSSSPAPASSPPDSFQPPFPLNDPGGTGVYGVAFSPDSSTLAAGDKN